MTPRRRRLWLVVAIVVGVSVAGGLALTAFRQNVMFFFDPSQVASGKAPVDERFRLGGMVEKGSVHRSPGSLQVRFTVTDFRHDVPVTYTGVLPDLFREGQGVIAHGRLGRDGTFVADEVLAKHDEKYMPPQIAQSLKDRHAENVPAPSAAPEATPPTAPESALPAAPEATPPTAPETTPPAQRRPPGQLRPGSPSVIGPPAASIATPGGL